MRPRFGLAALLLLAPMVLPGQAIRGTIVSGRDSTAVPGVVVLLVDQRDSVVSRALTNERGEYRLTAAAPGAYRVRTLRIGFRPLTSDPISLAGGQELTRRVSLADVAFQIDTVHVVAANSCRARPDPNGSVFAMWEQARTALTATQITSLDRGFAARTVTFERDLEPDGRRVRRQSSDLHTEFSARPWLTESADSLNRFGYVITDSDGSITYYAPDIDVLLSEAFLDAHCFRVSGGPNPNVIGIAFDPTRDRGNVPEIRGTLWLNKRTSELQRLEYRYANVSKEQEDAQAGGNVEFVRMTNGAWAISRWDIRMPVVEMKALGGLGATRAPEARLAEIRVAGGTLGLLTRGNDTLWSRSPLPISGSVMDSTSGKAIAGAYLAVDGTRLQAVSDASGRFNINGILPGRYALSVRTPSLDSLGAAIQYPVVVTDGLAQPRIMVPNAEQVSLMLCGNQRVGLIAGTVRLKGDSLPPGTMTVSAEWSDTLARPGEGTLAAGEKRLRKISSRADAQGRFHVCGVPVKTALVVRVTGDSIIGAPVEAQVAEAPFARAELIAERHVTRTATLAGVVTGDNPRKPLADVEVLLPALSLSGRSNSRGEFTIAGIPAGPHRVTVRSFGFNQFEATVAFAEQQTVHHEIFLTRVTKLDSLRIIAAANPIAGFEERRKLGAGQFVTRAQLERQESRRLSDIMSSLRATKIVSGSGNHAWLGNTRSPFGNTATCFLAGSDLANMAKPCVCYATVFLNGVLVYGRDEKDEILFDVNSIPVGSIESIEYYASAGVTPMQFTQSRSFDCGTLVIWTRRSS